MCTGGSDLAAGFSAQLKGMDAVQIGQAAPECYRLIVTLDEREEVEAGPRFDSFERAQTHVAFVVRRCQARGTVTAVRLERAADCDCEHEPRWTLQRRWDRAVIERILRQDRGGAARPRQTPAARRPRESRRREPAERSSPPPRDHTTATLPHLRIVWNEAHAEALEQQWSAPPAAEGPRLVTPRPRRTIADLFPRWPIALPPPATSEATLALARRLLIADPTKRRLRAPHALPFLPCAEDVKRRAEPAAAVPTSATVAVPAVEAQPPRRSPRPGYRSHGWHYAALVAFIALIWFGVLLLQLGGQLSLMLEGGPQAESPRSGRSIPEYPAESFNRDATTPPRA